MQHKTNAITEWVINIPTLKNPLLWYQLAIVALLSSSYILLLLIGLNLYEYQWQEIPSSFAVAFILAGGLFGAFSLISLALYWRGIPTKYVVHSKHIEQHTLTRSKKWLGLIGLLFGRSSGVNLAGASLLAKSREVIATDWKNVSGIKVFPSRHEIRLLDSWHTAMQVICPEEEYNNILKIIRQKTGYSGEEEPVDNPKEPSLATKLVLSIASIVAGVFLFPRLPIRFVGVFTIGVMLFAILSIWSSGWKKRVFSSLVILIVVAGTALAFSVGEVDMTREGTTYALLIELVLLGFFLTLGVKGIFPTKFRN